MDVYKIKLLKTQKKKKKKMTVYSRALPCPIIKHLVFNSS